MSINPLFATTPSSRNTLDRRLSSIILITLSCLCVHLHFVIYFWFVILSNIYASWSSFFFYRISSSHIFNSVCWSHALVNGPTSKWPASDGGRCSGQLLMMWSAVCSGSPHSHAALSASPHFFMEALYRPTPVRSLFRVVQCFRLSSSPLTPSSGSDTWRCTRVGPDASHSCFHVAAIHASFDRSSGMTLSIS